MKEDLVRKLEEKYPKIFAKQYGGMCIGDGWYNIIDSLCGVIQSQIDNANDQNGYDRDYNKMVADIVQGKLESARKLFDWLTDEQFALRVEQIKHEGPRPVTNTIKQATAVQVKEKFGGLRFYINGGDDYIHGAITMAENIAYHTCQECGNEGSTEGSVHWIGVLCPTHRAEYNAKLKRGEY